MSDIFILSACRTPIGKFGGALKDIPAPRLGAVVVKEAIRRSGTKPEDVDEVYLGNVLQAGLGQNVARQAQIYAGLPNDKPAYAINHVCASGLTSANLGAQSIICGNANVVVAGGTENMSAAPYLLPNARWGHRMNDGVIVDSMIKDGLWEIFNNYHMGITAENVAAKYSITREAQDKFAYESQMKCAAAMKAGKFRNEIIPVEIPQRKGPTVIFDTDEFPRPDTTLGALAKLSPAFKKDGTVTAGNASGINDGAAAVVLASGEYVKRTGAKPIARIVSFASVGVDPAYMGIGPIGAVRKALEKAKLSISDIDLFELNEAFAAQSIAVMRELGLDQSKVNVNGGAIALGHPIGASGARILTTLLYEMQKRGSRYGVASLCVGGGQGVATIVELVK